MCAQWKITHKWHLRFNLALASALPFYDSLISFPKPHLIPEPLLSIAHVQFVCGQFFLEILWRLAGISALRGRNFRSKFSGTFWGWPRGGLPHTSSSSTPAPLLFSLACPKTLLPAELHRDAPAPEFAGSKPDLHLLDEGILLLHFVSAMDVGKSLFFESRTNSYFV